MRALVTGGAGFLGSHLCETLLDRGDEVICMDNLISGREENVAAFRSNPRFHFVLHDVTKPFEIDGPIDAILHFASPASPVIYLRYRIQTLKVGSLGTHNTLGLAKAKNAAFLLASTSEIYGDPLVSPQPESYWGNVNTIGPRGVYDEAKRFAEAITMAYHTTHGVRTRIARIFNTFGPRMRPDDGRAVCSFIAKALRGEDLTVTGDGSQTRSFCYVSDLIDGLLKLLASDVTDPVNLGNPEEITILQLAEEVLELTGSRSRIVNEPAREDDPRRRRPDITRAREWLGWEPRVPRREGLTRTIEAFRAAP